MFSRISTVLLILAGLTSSSSAQAPSADAVKKCNSAATVPFADAERRAAEKGAVEVPPLAKQLRLQGSVFVEVCADESGEVVLTKLVRGHPILAQSAIESARKWRFQPSGTGSFKTVLEIAYSMGSTKTEIADEEKSNNSYFTAEDKCRDSLRSQKFDDAVKRCASATEIVEKLPKERTNERRSAYGLLGQAYFGQRKFEDASRQYAKELEIGKSSLGEDQAELAYAYHHVALAAHALGRAADAADNYAKAERTLALARDHIGLEELKPRHAATLKQIRENYLILLKQTGQTDLEKRMAAAK